MIDDPLLAELVWSAPVFGIERDAVLTPALPKDPLLLARFGALGLRSAMSVAGRFRTPQARALFGGSAAPSFLPLSRMGSASFGLALMLAGHATGWPAAKGGSSSIINAMAAYLRSLGGEIETGRRVRSLRDLPLATVALFDVIHSLDRPALVAALARAMEQADRRIPCFVQVNIGDEPQKGGCAIADLPALLAEARAAGIPLAGLMCVPPAQIEPAPYFALLAKLAKDNGLSDLSMGMSGDYETAVMLGATHLRVGTALFGTRS